MAHRKSAPPAISSGASAICFNEISAMPYPLKSDLLVDTGILVAWFDKKDCWHDAVSDFFNRYVIEAEFAPTFYVTPDIINEYLHRSFKNYQTRSKKPITLDIRQRFSNTIRELIQSHALEFIDLTHRAVLDAIDRWGRSSYGAKDAFHISCQHDWGMDLITVDHRLMEDMENDSDFKGRTVYYPSLEMRK